MAAPQIIPYEPSWLEQGRDKIAQGLLSSGLISDNYRAYNTANSLLGVDPSGRGAMGVADFVPGASLLKGAAETRDAANRGDYAEAGLLGLSSLVGEVPGVGDALSAMFIGPLARNADKMMLGVANKMEAAGIRPKEIWEKTGWGRGADGMWRSEVSDAPAQMVTPSQDAINDFMTSSTRLESIYENPEVFESYPQLRDVRVEQLTDQSGPRGSYNQYNNTLGLLNSLTEDEAKSVIAHELQHGIQNIEGFARGGNIDTARDIAKTVGELEASHIFQSGMREPINKHQEIIGQLRALRPAQIISDMDNITRPRDLFNSSYWYEYGDDIRSAIGPPPKRGSSLPYAKKAGKLIARRLEAEPTGLYARQILDSIGPKEVNKKIRNLERQSERLRSKKSFQEASAANRTLKQRRGLLAEENDYDTYQRLAGEVEARSTQDRLLFDAAQRRATPPFVTESIPRRLQIPYRKEFMSDVAIMPERNQLDVLYPRGLLMEP